MNILSYNCLGLGKAQAERSLIEIVRRGAPKVVFLMETKSGKEKMEKIRRKLGFHGCFTVENVGRSGGLCMLWEEDIVLDILSYTNHHIDASIKLNASANSWRFTGMYGWPKREENFHTWSLLKRLNEEPHDNWLCAGDFNLLLNSADKEGGREPSFSMIAEFREVLDECGLRDISFKGNRFTWDNSRDGVEFIQERIDLAFANESMLERFPDLVVHHLPRAKSDHVPISIQFQRHDDEEDRPKGPRPFRFEPMWLDDDSCQSVIENGWNNPGSRWAMEGIEGKIMRCTEDLSEWNLDGFGEVNTKLKEVKEELKEIHKKGMNGDLVRRRKELEDQLSQLERRVEMYWFQRARANEFKWVDRNTKFFHLKASGRKRRNKIRKLIDEEGLEWRSHEGMKTVALDYFQNLFRSDANALPDTASQGIEPKVSKEDNAELLLPFTGEEVKVALFSMHPTKAPGPDGMSALFYQKFWHIVGPDVISFVLDILNGSPIPNDLNYTFITLIPKVSDPCRMKDLRPISLCNVLYKIVAKVLANRLKKCLHKIISPSQSAFVPGRLITDNVLAAFEIFHHMKTKTTGKKGYMALKLDMAKAYDRVEWDFLEHSMTRLGFAERWTKLIMECVRSVSFSVLLSGYPTERFSPARGLRQGDPLSPYLFLLCAEALSGLLRRSELEGRLSGISIARNAPRVSHLFFADDCVLFAKATCQQSTEIVKILQTYGAASGQQVNLAKSELSFSKNVLSTTRTVIQQVLGIREVEKHEKYLGLPTMIGRSKKIIFNQIKERVLKKVKGWKERTLSRGGKEVLLKTIAQAIPLYTMSCFYIPSGVCREIEQLLCNFWWGDESEKKKVHWVSWKNLCKSKEHGGMGFRDLEIFNLAILAKQGWRLIQEPDTLLARMLKARYFRNSSFLEADMGYTPSYVWRSLLRGREALEAGLLWNIGNGSEVSVWKDKWLPRPTGFKLIERPPHYDEELRVIDLIDWETKRWREDEVRNLLNRDDTDLVLQMRLLDPKTPDTLIWYYEKSGIFSVKTAYHMFFERKLAEKEANQSDSSRICKLRKKVWKIDVPPRIKSFIWRACRNILPCNHNLVKRKINIELNCARCGLPENEMHALYYCQDARRVWKCFPELDYYGKGKLQVLDFLEHILSAKRTELLQLWAMLLCELWHARNKFVFEGRDLDQHRLIERVLKDQDDFRRAITADLKLEIQDNGGNAGKWLKPTMGVIKINVDAAVDERKGCGIGLVARDGEGEALFAGAKRVQSTPDVEIVEAEAILWAVRVSLEQELTHICIESDCLSLVQKLSKGMKVKGTIGNLLNQINKLCSSFVDCKWSFARREANKAAHLLANIRPCNMLFSCFAVHFPADLNLVLFDDLS